jgi:uridine kinase
VAVDGVDGAGKTHFADELASELTARGAAVIRASVDGFHNPLRLRYRRGRSSPEGFFRDSYNYERLIRLLLAPLSPGGSGRYVRRVYDVHAERAVAGPIEQAAPEAVLVFDGIFVHRDVLAGFWDYSVWLEVPFAVSVPRGAQRGYGNADLGAASNRRYVQGQRLYVTECDPQARATIVIDNEHLDRPVLLRPRAHR